MRTKPWEDTEQGTTQQGKMGEKRQLLPQVSYSPVFPDLEITPSMSSTAAGSSTCWGTEGRHWMV